MSERLSDEQVAWHVRYHAADAARHALAREVQEWRAKAAADTSADCTCGFGGFHEELNPNCARNRADTVQDNPYTFTVQVREGSDGDVWWVHLDCDGDWWTWQYDTEAEAREHARLIVAALRNVEVEQ